MELVNRKPALSEADFKYFIFPERVDVGKLGNTVFPISHTMRFYLFLKNG
jgi:hypothetical protein